MQTFISMLLLVVPALAGAAELSFRESERGVSVYIDSRQPINVVEGWIDFDGDMPARIESGGSIVTLWIDKPALRDGRISFAGVIPGGFHGMAEPIRGFDGSGLLFFVPGVSGIPQISVRAYLHDGAGTRIPVTLGTSTRETRSDEADVHPPEAVRVAIEEADGLRILTAIGSDAGSGVARYEVSRGGEWSAFTPPLELAAGDRERIAVRIFDHAGNFREIVVQEGAEREHSALIALIAICLGVAIATYLIVRMVRRTQRAG